MVYHQAVKYSHPQPCTNVPVICTLCKPLDSIRPSQLALMFWKYNLRHHFYNHHMQEDNTYASMPPSMIVSTFISSQEEAQLGIAKEETQAFRDSFEPPLLGSDDVRSYEEEAKRARSASSAQNVSRPNKRSKNG